MKCEKHKQYAGHGTGDPFPVSAYPLIEKIALPIPINLDEFFVSHKEFVSGSRISLEKPQKDLKILFLR